MPTSGLGNFAAAAARRYPWVRLWTAWNEPDLRTFAAPVSPSPYVRHVLNPAWAALHRANRANRVAGGVTSPRRTPSGMAPIAFAEGMRRAHARLDAYAANLHPVSLRHRMRTVLWGQVRPGSGRRPYAIQRVRHGRWVNVGGWRTGVGGTFRVTVNLARGTRVRLRSSRVPWPSPAMAVT